MFTGSYFHTMDNKGRVSIPARYKEIIKDRKDKYLTITNWEGYVLAFPQSEWIIFAAELAKKPILDPEFRPVQRFLIAGAEECALDRQGRILVSQNLRDYAKLSREVVLVGALRCFEIWDRSNYESHRQNLEKSLNAEMLHGLLI
jgi:transcriptional regulator MraZ